MIEAKKAAHRFYDQWRSLPPDSSEAAALQEKMSRVYHAAARAAIERFTHSSNSAAETSGRSVQTFLSVFSDKGRAEPPKQPTILPPGGHATGMSSVSKNLVPGGKSAEEIIARDSTQGNENGKPDFLKSQQTRRGGEDETRLLFGDAEPEAREYVKTLPPHAKASRKAFKAEVAKDLPGLAAHAGAMDDLFGFAALTPREPARKEEHVRDSSRSGGTPSGDGSPADAEPGDAARGSEETGGGRDREAGGNTGAAQPGGANPLRAKLERPLPADARDRNHTIADGEEVAPRGNTAKYDANLAAIRLLHEIDELPARMQEAIHGILAGKTLEEIGQGMGGITKQGVRRLATEAMRRLRGKLGEQGVSQTSDLLRSQAVPDDFNEKLERVRQRKLSRNESISMGWTPDVLKKSGAPDLVLNVTAGTLEKASEKHGIDLSSLKNLPQKIARPMMVVKNPSQTGVAHVTVFTDVTHNGKPVLAAVEFGKQLGRMLVNNIVTVHPKDRFADNLEHWLDAGLVRYFDRKKGEAWLRELAPRQLQRVLSHASEGTIRTEESAVNPKLPAALDTGHAPPDERDLKSQPLDDLERAIQF